MTEQKYFGRGGKHEAARFGSLVPWLSALYSAYNTDERRRLPRKWQGLFFAELGAIAGLCACIPASRLNADQCDVVSRVLARIAEVGGWFGRAIIARRASVIAKTGYKLCLMEENNQHPPRLLSLTLAQLALLRGDKLKAGECALRAIEGAEVVRHNDQRARVYRDAALIFATIGAYTVRTRRGYAWAGEYLAHMDQCGPFQWHDTAEKNETARQMVAKKLGE